MNTNTITLSSACHLPVHSAWNLILRPLARLRGRGAARALMSLALAGLLSLWSCLRDGWRLRSRTQPAEPRVRLLCHSRA